ncbi:MAG: WD40/YVTN/BNR-like repeat-containing protein [Bacillota bacterium]
MVDATTGWAATTDSKPLNIRTLVRTTDGGATWKDVTPRFDAGAIVGPAYFLDASTAWLVVGREGISGVAVFRTFDGGTSWRAQTVTTQSFPQATLLTASDAKHLWLVTSYGFPADGVPSDLFRSEDGGYNWRLTASTSKLAAALPYNGTKDGLTFIDDQHGWLAGTSHDTPIWFFATADGGKTWALQALPLPSGYTAAPDSVHTNAPAFFNDGQGARNSGLLPMVFLKEQQPNVFYKTGDAGKTWSPTAPAGTYLSSWSFVDAGHGFALGGGKLWVTTDGGQTWTELHPNYDLNEVTQIDFVSDQLGWAIGKGFFIKTADGGKTWGPVTAAGK